MDIHPVWKNNRLWDKAQELSTGMLKAMLTFHNQFAISHSFLSPLFQNRRQITQLTRFIKHGEPCFLGQKRLPTLAGAEGFCTSKPTYPWTTAEHQHHLLPSSRDMTNARLTNKTRLQCPHNSCHL